MGFGWGFGEFRRFDCRFNFGFGRINTTRNVMWGFDSDTFSENGAKCIMGFGRVTKIYTGVSASTVRRQQ